MQKIKVDSDLIRDGQTFDEAIHMYNTDCITLDVDDRQLLSI